MQTKLITLLIKTLFITKKNKLLLYMTLLASASIIIATIACVLTIAIQDSFHTLLWDQLKTSAADITIMPKRSNYFSKKHINYLNKSPFIQAWAPTSWRYVLVTYKTSTSSPQTAAQVATIKFVNQHKEKFFLLKNHAIGINDKDQLLNGVIIGKQLQENLGTTKGKPIHLTFLEERTQRKRKIIKPKTYTVTINDTISTGIPEIDTTLILCSYDLGKTFMPDLNWDEITILTKQNNINAIDITISTIKKEFPELSVHSFKESHPTFFAAILLEQYVARLYLLLLLFFVVITLVALFSMQIIYNQKKIIILQFLGINKKTLYIFTFFSIITQTCISSFMGICIARIIAYWITTHTPQEIKQAYLISHLPIEFSMQLVITIMGIMIFIAIIAGYCTFLFFSQYNTIHTLKNET